MAHDFAGKIELDIRDSVPDWAPFLAPKAPAGAPNVLFVVWDDVGYGTMDCFGGPVRTPTMSRIADAGRAVLELPHHSAVLAYACLAPHRPQRDLQRHGDDRGVQLGVPRHLDPDPVRERLHLRGAGGERLQHLLRGQVAPDPG